jgi:hypothetical protein
MVYTSCFSHWLQLLVEFSGRSRVGRQPLSVNRCKTGGVLDVEHPRVNVPLFVLELQLEADTLFDQVLC